MKKLLVWVLAGLCLYVLSGFALADQAVSYIERSWNGSCVVSEEKQVTVYHAVDENVIDGSSTIILSEEWYVVEGDKTIENKRLSVKGSVNLILKDGATLDAQMGIQVGEGNTLNIYAQSGGTGTLNAKSPGDNTAAIGGNKTQNSGTVVIHGGQITAFTSTSGAGIGGGFGGDGGSTTIHDGIVEINNAQSGAGIGGGENGAAGTITINGGTVIVQNGSGASIGVGNNGSGGTVLIRDGEIRGGEITENRVGRIEANNVSIEGGEITVIEIKATTVNISDGKVRTDEIYVDKDSLEDEDNGVVKTSITGGEITANESNLDTNGNWPVSGTAHAILEENPVKGTNHDTLIAAGYPCSLCNRPARITETSVVSVTLSQTSFTYDGAEKDPVEAVSLSITLNGKMYTMPLVLGMDYKVAYVKENGGEVESAAAPGSYTVKIKPVSGDFNGIVTNASFTITGSTQTEKQTLSTSDFTLSSNSLVYNGTAQKPTISAKKLTENTDYTVTYPEDMMNAGTKTITVAGTGNYTGTVELKYTIEKATPAADMFSVTFPENLYYNGKEKYANVKVNESISGMGDITVSYYRTDNPGTDVEPVETGSYRVKISVAETDNYAAVNGLMPDTWTFTIQPSASVITAVKDQEAYTYGDVVKITATVRASGEAQKEASILSRIRSVPATMALYADGKQISGAVTANENGEYVMTYDTSDKAIAPEDEPVTLIVRYSGDRNTQAYEQPVSFTLGRKKLILSLEGSVSKVYDGTTDVPDSSGLTVVLEGIVGSDTVRLTEPVFAYDTADAGERKTIIASGLALGDGEEDNRFYTLDGVTSVQNNGGVITKARGSASVSMAGWIYGETPSEPIAASKTNGTSGVTYQYKRKDAGDDGYTDVLPTEAGVYTVKAIFPETRNYAMVTAEADFEVFQIQPSVPNNLTAIYGQTLKAIPLPEGWEWVNPEQEPGKPGERTRHAARFKGDANHLPAETEVTILVRYLPEDMAPDAEISGMLDQDGWFTAPPDLMAADGTQISIDGEGWADSISLPAVDGEHEYVYYVRLRNGTIAQKRIIAKVNTAKQQIALLPETGDESRALLWILMLLTAGAVLLQLRRRVRK